MFKVKLLHENAKIPVCAHPAQDLCYDLFSCEEVVLLPGLPTKVGTGIAVDADGFGFLILDRSSMASKGITVSGGVIDAGYRGEIILLMTYNEHPRGSYTIKAGDKVAQMLPVIPATHAAFFAVEELGVSVRGSAGFGSTGV